MIHLVGLAVGMTVERERVEFSVDKGVGDLLYLVRKDTVGYMVGGTTTFEVGAVWVLNVTVGECDGAPGSVT